MAQSNYLTTLDLYFVIILKGQTVSAMVLLMRTRIQTAHTICRKISRGFVSQLNYA